MRPSCSAWSRCCPAWPDHAAAQGEGEEGDRRQREGGKEGGSEGGSEGGREGVREGGKERGR